MARNEYSHEPDGVMTSARSHNLRLAVLFFLNGIFFCACVFLWINANYEDRLYSRLVDSVVADGASQRDTAIALLHATHELIKPRLALFGTTAPTGLREKMLNSGDLALNEGTGACGSYTHVLARALRTAGLPVRIAQMRCAEKWGCHILLETQVDGHWAVLDPSFDLAFYNRDGSLASFKQVRADWTRHRTSLPVDYPIQYAYEAVRYTNWTKIPWLMPALKQLLDAALGANADQISIRAHVLNLYRTYLWACAALLLISLIISARYIRR